MERGYTWSDGSPVTFINWHSSEPSNNFYDNCIEMYQNSFQWNDLRCLEARGYICKQPLGKQRPMFLLRVPAFVFFFGEQGWRSGESTRLPPMWPGFESWRPHHMWVECVVGSLPCYERFFFGYSGFPLSLKTNAPQFIWNARTRLNEILRTPKCSVGKQITKFTILVVGMSKRVVAPNTVTAELSSCYA